MAEPLYPAARADLRNVAIIAHVDHGKTTLVDAMLWQSGAFRSNETVNERVMDSMDLEREKGITILAKNTAVERALTMVDGVLLLVDSSEGPLPQTRFVLRKALELELPVVLVINKIDRPDARIAEVVDEVYELFLDLDATEDQIDFPIVYANARRGTATLDPDRAGHRPAPHVRDAAGDRPRAPPRSAAAAPGLGHQPRRQPVCGPHRHVPGHARNHQARPERGLVPHRRHVATAKITELYVTESLDRVDAAEAGAGEIIAISGIADITIGETLADLADPVPLPAITVDEPSLSITIGTNTSPMAGLEGAKVTARLIKNRLDAELVGNVSIRLAVLVEIMRREGFEMTVGKPRVITRTIDERLHEPTERITIDIPESFVGAVTQLLGERKADMVTMTNHGTGWVRLDYIVAARGLIGFRTEFLTETRGTGLATSVFEGYTPWLGELRTRRSGSIVSDRRGAVTGYAIAAVQERASLFVAPGEEVYEGMVIGENPRPEDMDVNICREKKQTNIRAAASDDTVRLTPPRVLSLEQALEFIADDECVEVTPQTIRLRKEILDADVRGRHRKRLQRNRSAV
ncbi:50S ribosomal subunit assembly factor BipA [Geodia barretti]|uniref:50S ribosomal subunit assembly factor BipA n=1 Tax=Geodia barretti TaxID=519541 RepID=A0AA35T7L9_GEOBA|nr:50S ribosomal subunit assembly factor BipA [Geodia barretti]